MHFGRVYINSALNEISVNFSDQGEGTMHTFRLRINYQVPSHFVSVDLLVLYVGYLNWL